MMKKLILNLGLFAALTGMLSAGEIVTYQGRLKESGSPANGNRTFLFDFCATDVPSGCIASLSGAQSFQVSNGLFKSTFTAPAVDLSAGPWYLRVWVDGTALSPVERLTHVPYAVHAASASYAAALAVSAGQGVYASTNVFVLGNLSVSDWAVYVATESTFNASALLTDRNPGAEDVRVAVMGYARSDSGDTNDIMAGGNFEAEVPVAMNGRMVGVRTVNRNYGSSPKAIGLMVDSVQNTGTLGETYGIWIATMTGGTQSSRPYALYSGDPNAASYFAGPVGISSVPAYSLAVSSGTGDIFWVAHDAVHAVKFVGDGSGLTGVTGASGTDNTKVLKSGDFMSGQLTIDGSSLTVRTGNAVHFAADSTGKVGINSYPDGMAGLSIYGSGIYDSGIMMYNGGTSWALTNNSGVLTIVKGDGATYVPLQINPNGDMTLFRGAYYVGGSTFSVVNSRVGVGTPSPLYLMHVSTGAGETGSLLVISTGASDVVRMTGEGKVYANKYYGDGSSLTGIIADLSSPSGTLAVADGGTGGANAADARTNLGVVALAGDTMSGPLAFSLNNAVFSNSLNTGAVVISTGGAITTTGPGTGSVPGNARGLGAVDLQTARSALTQVASGNFAAVAGGYSNTAAQQYAVVSGGNSNSASGQMAVVGGGNNNDASGGFSTIPGGDTNFAGGLRSFAAGFKADSSAAGAFTWADSEGTLVSNPVTDMSRFKARGGFLVSGSTDPVLTGALNRGFLVTGGGLVGVSTGAPQASLDVVSDNSVVSLPVQIWRDSSGNIVSSMSSAGHMMAARYVGDGSGLTNVAAASGTDSTKVLKTGDTMTGQLTLAGSTLTVTGNAFSVGGSTLTVKDGYLGLGTLTPSARLHVVSDNGYVHFTSPASPFILNMVPQTYSPATINNNGAGPLVFSISNAEQARFTTSNMMGVGTASPLYRLHVSSGAGEAGIIFGVSTGAVTMFSVSGAGEANASAYLIGNVRALSHTNTANLMVGKFAGVSATSGDYNTFLGDYSGYSNTSGNSNSAVGNYAAYYNASGSFNTVMGQYAGYGASGFPYSNMTLLGYQAGYALQGGAGNVFLGYRAGHTLATGTGNIVIGADITTPDVNSSNTLNIGGILYGDLAARTIGVSTRVPQAALDVVSTGTAANVYAQIWRNASGLIVASMTSTGMYFGNASGLTGIPADNLGNHTATQDLNLAGLKLVNVSTIAVSGENVVLSPFPRDGNYDYAISIGSSSGLNYTSGIGIGYGAFNNHDYGVGVGRSADTNHTYGTGLGNFAHSNFSNGVGVGTSANTNNTNGVGVGANANNNNSFGTGLGASASSNSSYGTGVGAYSSSNYNYGVGVGAYSQNNFDYGTGVGAYTSARSSSAALGYYAKAPNQEALALGAGSKANAFQSVAIGAYTVNDATGTAKIWNNGVTISTGGAIQTTGLGHGGTAGNPRGYGAVDLQSIRSAAAHAASGMMSVLSGGGWNEASGAYATVPGGSYNQAAGNYSFAAGYAARSLAQNSFTWSDSGGNFVDNNVPDRAVFKTKGGFLVTGSTNTVIGATVDRGVLVTNGMLAVSTGVPMAAVDVVSSGTAANIYAQVWRNSSGVVVASMSSQGHFSIAQAMPGDNLGTHNASQNLQLNWNNILTVSSIAAAGHITAGAYQINGSTVLAVSGGNSLGVGPAAGRVNSGGNNNFIGANSGYNNSSGNQNNFMGANAGYNNTTGQNNTFVGNFAGYGNNLGTENIYIGDNAGYSVPSGRYNSVVGNSAGLGSSSNYSSATLMGYAAGYSLTSGAGNTLLGYKAGYYVTTGSSNIVVGIGQDLSSPGDSNKLNIGGVLFGDLASGTIGISTRTPASALDVNGTLTLRGNLNSAGDLTVRSSAIGSSVTIRAAYGDAMTGGQVLIRGGSYTGGNNSATGGHVVIAAGELAAGTGGFNMHAGSVTISAGDSYSSEATSTGGSVILNAGASSAGTPGSLLFKVAGSEKARINSNGALGIGTASPNYRLDVQGGNINASGGMCIADTCVTSWSSVTGVWAKAGSVIYPLTPIDNVQINSTLTVSGSAFSVGGSAFAVAGDKVGIGTANPLYALEVSSAAGSSDKILMVSTGTVEIFSVKGNGEVYTAGKFIGDGSMLANVNAASLVIAGSGLSIATSAYAGASGVFISSGGAVQTAGAGHGSVAGAARGLGAVDLQTSRIVAGQVAGGQFSFLGGGQSNRADGQYSVIGGGQLNYTSGTNSFIGSGYQNSISIGYGTIGGGFGNTLGSNAGEGTIAGGNYNTVDAYYGAVGGGDHNTVAGQDGFVGGGRYNVVSGSGSAVAGGAYNVADGTSSVIGGGEQNRTTQIHSAVLGGRGNTAMGGSVVGGGEYNSAWGYYGSILGGTDNVAGYYAAVAGGRNNRGEGYFSFIGSGDANSVTAEYSAIGGGQGNVVVGSHSVTSGGMNNRAGGQYSFVGGGYQNKAEEVHSAVGGGWFNEANGMDSFVGGGKANVVWGAYSFVGGGGPNGGVTGNIVDGAYSAIVGGSSNTITSVASLGFIGGGSDNHLYGDASVVGGGSRNTAGVGGSKFYAAVLGGHDNQASGEAAFVGGGNYNIASGNYSMVPGGANNAASGDLSFAAGYRSSSTASGTFSWADGEGYPLVNDITDQARFKAKGGFWVAISTDYTKPGLFVSSANNVSLGVITGGPGTRLTVLEPNPQPDTGNSEVLRVGTGPFPGMLYVSTSGVVGMSQQSVAIASAPPMALAGTGWNPINSFNLEEIDTQNEMTTAGFTTRNPGRYLVTFDATMQCAIANNTVGVGVGVNGEAVPTRFATSYVGATGQNAVSFSHVFNLSAGSLLQFYFYNTLASAFNNFVPMVTVTKLN
ncbi:MAG: hypothetical protein A2049_02105 [Elusimicrobia bacterium GWA2_62_23]|nr:MAG: hypothetical protein A2049_02105 [Elusimicrobia bacterium GWA2_62_23]